MLHYIKEILEFLVSHRVSKQVIKLNEQRPSKTQTYH